MAMASKLKMPVKSSQPSKRKRSLPTNKIPNTTLGAEKRGARYLPTPNASVRERISRAFTHRLYLIDKKLCGLSPGHGHGEEARACDFIVLGATGNVYTVKLDLVPSCTCPDNATKGKTCKHILFIMLRVLKLPRDDPRVWQKALLPSELQSLIQNPSVNDAVLASSLVRQRFHQINETSVEEKSVQRSVEGDCPVCYEPMASDGTSELVIFCYTCGNNLHQDCFKRWSKSREHGPVTCIYCRALWSSNREGAGAPEYVNLASFSAVHGTEETSVEALYPDTYRWWSRNTKC